jgi:uncharacterized caspase-like protein
MSDRLKTGIVRTLVSFVCIGALLGVASGQEGKRVALVVGNDAYSIRPLQNAVNDARAMDKALRGAGFRTTLVENASKVAMEQAASDFLQAVSPGDTALFFYAGHAVQIENENVLIPVDFHSAKTLIEAKFRSFSLAMIFDYLKKSRAKTTIVIVDACRSNPVAEKNSLQAGLALPLNAGKDTYIAYSTSPNHVANDNPDGKNSWFTEALADLITQPGLTVDDVFTRVRLKVENATRGSQTPWSQTSLTSKFYFHPPANQEALNEASLSDKWLQDALKDEHRGNWQQAIDSFNRIVKQAPGSPAERVAKATLPYVTARNEAALGFEARDFGKAGTRLEDALRLDPFAFDAGLNAASSYLLSDQIPKAVAVLKTVRQRGTSAAAAKAEAILKELAVVEPLAGEELKRGVPQPPPIEEIFTTAELRTPNWDAGRRLARRSETDFAKWAAKMPIMSLPLPEPEPAPVQTASAAGAEGPITIDSFHVEIQSVTRDLIREEFGTLELKSDQPGAAVMLDGKTMARQLPFTLKVAAGKYQIRAIDHGKTLITRDVEVTAGATVDVSLK